MSFNSVRVQSNFSKDNTQLVAVSVRNGWKSYRDGQSVLENFNMTVAKGTIYSLLGPSGCGKTTILSAIVGIESLSSGDVSVFGKCPGTVGCGVPGPIVGYMPQGITLYDKLTIRDTFLYFGRIYGMTESSILQKIVTLSEFLDLPQSSSRISILSGGQKRRVSLAVCLLHEPKLLILDEPTVGVDPLLRERIWTYLLRLVAEQRTTVIITTHYVEETKDSHTIGIMRNGRILIEESPRVLMKQHNSPYLEEVVTKLFKDVNEVNREEYTGWLPSIISETSVEGTSFRIIDPECDQWAPNNPVSSPTRSLHPQSVRFEVTSKYNKTKALVTRNFLNFIRNPVMLYLFLFLPSLNGIIVHFTVGVPPKNLNLGVVSPEISNDSIANCMDGWETSHLLSCGFLEELSSVIISPVSMESESKALASVIRGDTRGYVKFPANYSSHVVDRVIAGNFPENESLVNSDISFRLDRSDFVAAYFLEKAMYRSYLAFTLKALDIFNVQEKNWVVNIPLNFRKPVYGSEGHSNTSTSSAVLLLITFFIPTLTTCLATITDRKYGTMARTLVAGASKLDYLLALTITEGTLILVQSIISYAVGTLVMQWDVVGSHLAAVGLMFLTGMFGMSFSFLLAQFCKEEMEAVLIAIGFFISHISTTGLMWPLEGTSPAVRFMTNLTPLNWAIEALRSIIIRGWPLTHHKVYPALIVLAVATLLPAIIAIRFWRKE